MAQGGAATFGSVLRRWEFWLVAVIATPIFASSLVWGTFAVAAARERTLAERRERALPPSRGLIHLASRKSFEAVQTCLAPLGASPAGFPQSLADSPCAAEANNAALTVHHKLEYTVAQPLLSDGRIPWYFLCAEPRNPQDPVLATSSFHDGVAWGDPSVKTCWSKGRFSGYLGKPAETTPMILFLACVSEYANAHPTQGYPSRVEDLGPSGTGCLPSELIVNLEPQRSAFALYAAGPPDPQGRVRSFDLRMVLDSTLKRSRQNLLIKEDGLIHVAHDRLATEADPDVKAFEAQQASQTETLTPGLFRKCEDGDLEVCSNLGVSLFKFAEANSEWGGPAERLKLAASLLQRACDGGHAPACFELKSTMEDDSPAKLATVRRSCELGYGRACEDLAGKVPGEAEAARLRGCAAGDADSCFWLWRKKAGLVSASQASLIEKALRADCEGLDASRCTRLAEVLEKRGQAGRGMVAELYRRACIFGGDKGACEIAKGTSTLDTLPVGATLSQNTFLRCIADSDSDECQEVRVKVPWPCKDGKASACWKTSTSAGSLLAIRRFCEAGYGKACDLASLQSSNVLPDTTKSCHTGSFESCFDLWRLTEDRIPEPERRREKAMREACERGVHSQCSGLARFLEKEGKSPPRVLQMINFLACQSRRDPEACEKTRGSGLVALGTGPLR